MYDHSVEVLISWCKCYLRAGKVGKRNPPDHMDRCSDPGLGTPDYVPHRNYPKKVEARRVAISLNRPDPLVTELSYY